MDTGEVVNAEMQRYENMIEIPDLGLFSMKEIQEALTISSKSSSSTLTQHGSSQLDNEGNDSDCSWTQTEDDGAFYTDIRRRLDTFILAADQTTFTTDVLSRRQRRFVHASAQVMRLGHASLGPNSRYRRMIIYKQERASCQAASTVLEQSNAEQLPTVDEHEALSPNDSRPRKRRRVQKVALGFPCRYEPCRRVFDRSSERTKHEQAHQIVYTQRFQCPQCDKGFRYPKDLRRHSKVHESSGYRDSTELLSTSFGSSAPITSMLTADSRVPSDTSLHFNSKGNSPLLIGPVPCDCNAQVDIEPLILDDTAWTPSAAYGDNDFHLPFDELTCFTFDENEEDFLELPKVRK